VATSFSTGSFELFQTNYAPGGRMGPHEDRIARVSVVTRGELWETVDGREERATSGSVVLKPAGVTHADELGPQGAAVLSFVLPEWAEGPEWRVLRWFHGGHATAAATRFVAAVRFPNSSPADAEDAIYDLLACVEGCGRSQPAGSPPPWLVRTRRRVAGEFAVRCSVRALAADAGVHPVYLTRMFRRHYGCSVMDYVRGLRVRAAADALASTRRSLAELALGAGFSDQSHLCRIFKADVGVTPGRYRSIMGRQ
jgi:AraC family transcriptional regulator